MNDQVINLKKIFSEKELLAILNSSENSNKVVMKDSFLPTTPDGDLDSSIKLLDETIIFNRKTIQELVSNGKVSEDIGGALLEIFDNHEKLINLKLRSNNHEDFQKILDIYLQEEAKKTSKQLSPMSNLFDLKELLNKNISDQKLQLKKNMNTAASIGVNKAIMDRLNHLPELLKNAILMKLPSGTYIITSELENSNKNIGTIGFEYVLTTKDEIIAKKEYDSYIKKMTSDALIVWLAYWAASGEVGYFNYLCPLTDIIKHTFMDNTRYPSTNEKMIFWELSSLLAHTSLTLNLKVGKEYITIKHPFLKLAVTASKEKGQEKSKGYPDKVYASVLDPNIFKNRAALETEISRGTLKMRGEDVFLALTLQIKAAQNKKTHDPFVYNESILMEKAGLTGTYNANPSVARRRLKEKLNKNIEAESIESWEKNKSKILIKKKK